MVSSYEFSARGSISTGTYTCGRDRLSFEPLRSMQSILAQLNLVSRDVCTHRFTTILQPCYHCWLNMRRFCISFSTTWRTQSNTLIYVLTSRGKDKHASVGIVAEPISPIVSRIDRSARQADLGKLVIIFHPLDTWLCMFHMCRLFLFCLPHILAAIGMHEPQPNSLSLSLALALALALALSHPAVDSRNQRLLGAQRWKSLFFKENCCSNEFFTPVWSFYYSVHKSWCVLRGILIPHWISPLHFKWNPSISLVTQWGGLMRDIINYYLLMAAEHAVTRSSFSIDAAGLSSVSVPHTLHHVGFRASQTKNQWCDDFGHQANITLIDFIVRPVPTLSHACHSSIQLVPVSFTSHH